MATYGGGTRINAAVSASATASTTGGNVYATVYTCPANCYAVLWVRANFTKATAPVPFNTAHYLYVGGQILAVTSCAAATGGYSGVVTSGDTSVSASNNSNTAISVFQVYVGPGQTVQVRADVNLNPGYGVTTSTSGTVQGVEFINS